MFVIYGTVGSGDSREKQLTLVVDQSSPDGNIFAIVAKCVQLKPKHRDEIIAMMNASHSYEEVLEGMKQYGIIVSVD